MTDRGTGIARSSSGDAMRSLFHALRQKAERSLVYPLNRDECLALIDAGEGALDLLDQARVRLRVNAIAWHTEKHDRHVSFEDCEIKACTNDSELLDRIVALLAPHKDARRV